MQIRYNSKPEPADDYTEAVARIEANRARQAKAGVLPVCQDRLLSHGEQVEQVVMFFHGFSTCPEQFHELGGRLFDLGYNVYLPCAPHHGLADRLTRELGALTAEELAEYGDRAVDIACGLGRHVTVVGISGGGTVVCWLAQNRADVDVAIPIAAMLGVSFVPHQLTRPFAWLFNRVPDFYMWWDPRTKTENPYSVYYAYPGYSIRALSEVLKLGVFVRQQARTASPRAKRIVMVVNEKEPGVNNREILGLLVDWQNHQGEAILRIFRFEPELNLPHDIITPETPGLQVETVYERLIQRIQAETSALAA